MSIVSLHSVRRLQLIQPTLSQRYLLGRKRLHSTTQSNGLLDRAVQLINNSFETLPRETLACMLCLEIASIYGTHQLIVASGVHVPAEFAVAFALARPLRRFRLPLELMGAGVLGRLVPQLKQIKITRGISGAIPKTLVEKWRSSETLRTGGEKLGGILDKYGAAYFIAARWTGVAIVFTIYGGTLYGLDVSGFMAKYGIEEYGSVIGSWAAAVSTSAVLYPCTIALGAVLARPVGLLTRRLY